MSWEKMKLAECCVSVADGDHQPPPKAESGVAFVTISNINKANQFDFSDAMYVPQEYYERLDSKRKAQAGDVLYSVVGSFGIPVLIKAGTPPFVFQRHIAILRPNDRIDSRFLYYTMLSGDFYAKADAAAIGAAQRTVSLSALRNIEIEVPPFETQRRIADILSAYDDLIENSQKQIKLLEEAAQRLYKEWFVDLRFPGHETTPIINGIPEGWIKVTIDAVCQTLGGGTPSTKVPAYYENGSILWVTPTDITKSNSLAILDTEKKITKEGLANSSAKMVPPGTILMTSRASIGFFGLFENEVCTNQGFINCIPNKPELQMFLLYNLKSRVDEIRQKASGSTFLEISKSAFREFQIIIPDDRTLQRFQDITYGLYKKVRTHTKQIYELTQVRNRLLPKLMNAEIEVHICKHNLAFHNSLCFQA